MVINDIQPPVQPAAQTPAAGPPVPQPTVQSGVASAAPQTPLVQAAQSAPAPAPAPTPVAVNDVAPPAVTGAPASPQPTQPGASVQPSPPPAAVQQASLPTPSTDPALAAARLKMPKTAEEINKEFQNGIIKPPRITSPTVKPIAIACALTAGLMTLTVLTYLQGGTSGASGNNGRQAADNVQPSHSEAPATPLTAGDVDSAVRYAEAQAAALERIEIPAETNLTDDALGL